MTGKPLKGAPGVLGTLGALAALLISSIFFSPASSLGGEVITSDFNLDGKPDGWSYFSNGRMEKQEIDVNYDGKVDTVYIYDGGGKVVEENLDTNYDGTMDNWRTYRDGRVTLDKVDSDSDGKVDLWVYVDKGGIYRIERDLDGDGQPDDASIY